jgi:hypothetical protein
MNSFAHKKREGVISLSSCFNFPGFDVPLLFNFCRNICSRLRSCLALAVPPLPLSLRPCLRGDSHRLSL